MNNDLPPSIDALRSRGAQMQRVPESEPVAALRCWLPRSADMRPAWLLIPVVAAVVFASAVAEVLLLGSPGVGWMAGLQMLMSAAALGAWYNLRYRQVSRSVRYELTGDCIRALTPGGVEEVPLRLVTEVSVVGRDVIVDSDDRRLVIANLHQPMEVRDVVDRARQGLPLEGTGAYRGG